MFEESLFYSSGKRENTKNWITMPISFLVHVLLLGSFVVVPLMKAAADLPEIEVINIFTTNEVPAPPSPPPAAKSKSSSTKKKEARDKESEQDEQQAQIDPGRLIAPVEIPEEIPEEDINFGGLLDDSSVGIEGGVEGGVEGGIVGGAIGGDLLDTGMQDIIKLGSVKPPSVIHRVKPRFPPAALQARITGRVVIRAITDIYGKVKEVRVVSSAHPLLNSACLKAIKQWLFEPYIINGIPRPVEFVVKLDFDLAN